MSEEQFVSETKSRRFRPYPKYKASGVEWLRKIPSHWIALSLKRICRLAYGDALQSDERREGNIEVFGSNGAVGSHDRANTLGPCLVVGRKGSFGKINYSANPVFAIDTTFFIDRHLTDVDLRWLFYILTWLRLDTISKDSAIPGLDRDDTYACLVPSCNHKEQQAIAAFLDHETAKIDGLIEKKERLIELLQEKRTALITQAVTKGLDPTVPMKDSGVEWLGNISAHWDELALKRVVDPERPVTYGIVQCGPDDPEGIPYIRPVDMSDEDGVNLESLEHTSAEIAAGYSRSVIKPDDIVVSIGPSFGKVMVVPPELAGANLTQGTARVAPGTHMMPRFLFWALRSDSLWQAWDSFCSGATFRALTLEILESCAVAVPPFVEQRIIAAFLDRETEKIDGLIKKINEAVDHLKEYRAALISAAVTGKIDVQGLS